MAAASCSAGMERADRDPEPNVRATHQQQTIQPTIVPPEPLGPRVPQVNCEVLKETGYRNGSKFAIEVISIDGRLIERATADAYWAMQLAAAKDGVELPIYSGFRTHEDQKYFRRCFKTCSCNQCTPASRPGHSKHQSGMAIDFGQWEGVIPWLEENGRNYRFFPTVRREPWHWEYRPRRRKERQLWPTLCPES